MSGVCDPLAALCAFLQVAVGDLLATVPNDIGLKGGVPAVFRPELPREFDQLMPTACLVARQAGGYKRFGASMMPVGDPLVDVIAYGTRQMQSTALAQAAIIALKQLVMEPWEGVMLHAANIAGGPMPLPDSHTLWPATFFSLQLVHGELPAPT